MTENTQHDSKQIKEFGRITVLQGYMNIIFWYRINASDQKTVEVP